MDAQYRVAAFSHLSVPRGSSGSKEGAVEISSGDDLGIRQLHSPKDGDGIPPLQWGNTILWFQAQIV